MPLYVVALGSGPLALGGLAAAAAFAGVPGALVVRNYLLAFAVAGAPADAGG